MCEKCNKGKYYITTAIAYASGKPHIGNTYEIVLADAIARYKRSQGYDVFFQTGTDEHGQKIELKADEAGVTPKEFVDNASCEIKKIWDLMNTSYDKFIRTTDEDHEKQVQKIFKKLYGTSIYQYVKQYRLEQATIELTNSARSITDIALDAGFSSASKFGESFKKRYGVTPTEYRLQFRDRNGIIELNQNI